MSGRGATTLLDATEELRTAVADVQFPFQVAGADHARDSARRLHQQLDDYILPRLRDLDAPVVCVVGGSTGAGKSTLVNSLVGRVVSRAGVLRPTTRASVLVVHPDDLHWFTDDRVLPALARVTGDETEHADAGSLRLVEATTVRPGLALLDAPDIDSVVHSNRELSRQLLAAADLWLFVTTAARYADAVPWELLREAAERGTSVAIVLDRVPPEAIADIRVHLAQMLQEQGLPEAPIFPILETGLTDGLLPDRETQRVQSWLTALAGDTRARERVVRATLDGALGSLAQRTERLLAHAALQQSAHETLQQEVTTAYTAARDGVEKGIEDGTLLRGEVLARWQELVGTGEFLRQIEAGIARARDRVTAFFHGKAPSTEPLGEALQTGAAALVTAQTQLAATATAQSWRATPAGAALLTEHSKLTEAEPDVPARVDRLIRDWQGEVLELIRSQAGRKRATARYLAFGVNGLAVLLMLVVFSATAGLSGAEVAIAGGSAVIAQRLLEAIFGDQAVRELAAAARRRLIAMVDELLETEKARFLEVLAATSSDPEAWERLRVAVRAVEGAR